jgi:two-component system invasion response regulator UvrY
MIRLGIKSILQDLEGVQVVGEAGSGEEAVNLVRELLPHLVIIDISMPGIGGMEAILRMASRKFSPKILVVSSYTNDIIPARLISMGVAGYLTKDAASFDEMLVEAVKKIIAGGRYIDPTIMDKLIITQQDEAQSLDNIKKSEQNIPFQDLNDREFQVLIMVAKGMDAKEIAKKLYLTRKTVNAHRNMIHKKLGVKSDMDVMQIAIEKGLIDASFDWH